MATNTSETGEPVVGAPAVDTSSNRPAKGITSEIGATQGDYVPDADQYQVLPDGRVLQLAVKGTPMPVGEARNLGLIGGSTTKTKEGKIVEGEPPVSETKRSAPVPIGAERAPQPEAADETKAEAK